MGMISAVQCGYGAIGKKLFPEFKSLLESVNGKDGPSIMIYDPPYQRSLGMDDIDIDLRLTNEHYDIAFICVPTETKDDGTQDTSAIEDVLSKLSADIIVVKSTISLDTAKLLPSNAIYSPEFSSTTVHGGTQRFVILGGDREICNKVAQLYMRANSADFHICYTDIKTAIMTKYALNSVLAAKVTLFNEIADCCKQVGVEYDDVRNLLLMDQRISPSHTWSYDDQPFYDSHCFNKDVPAFVKMVDAPLLSKVVEINKLKKQLLKPKA